MSRSLTYFRKSSRPALTLLPFYSLCSSSPGNVSLNLPLTDQSSSTGYLYVFRLSWVLITTANVTLVKGFRAGGTAETLLTGNTRVAGAVTLLIGLIATGAAVIALEEAFIAGLRAYITLLIVFIVLNGAVITPVEAFTAGGHAA